MRSKTLREGLSLDRKRRPYIVDPFLPVGGLLTIHGAPKALKSMLTKNALLEIADGQKMWGRWKPHRQVRCLYLDMEHGEDMFLDSLEKIQQQRNFFDAPDRFHYVSRDTELRLDTREGVDKVRKRIEEVDPDLMVLDPWSEFHDYDEGDGAKQRGMLRRLRAIKPSMALWVIHHDCKPGEFRTSGTPEAMRGNVLHQASDSIISIRRSDHRVRFTFTLRYDDDPCGGVPFELLYDKLTDTFKEVER